MKLRIIAEHVKGGSDTGTYWVEELRWYGLWRKCMAPALYGERNKFFYWLDNRNAYHFGSYTGAMDFLNKWSIKFSKLKRQEIRRRVAFTWPIKKEEDSLNG